jgi:hypothetical protein
MNATTRPLSALVTHYNAMAVALGKPTVKRFADREAAERRLAALQAEYNEAKPETPKTMLPFRDREIPGNPEKMGKHPAPNSLAGRCLVLLSRPEGGSLQEVEALVEEFDKERGKPLVNIRRRAHDLVDLMHRRRGFVLRYKEGRAYIILPEVR